MISRPEADSFPRPKFWCRIHRVSIDYIRVYAFINEKRRQIMFARGNLDDWNTKTSLRTEIYSWDMRITSCIYRICNGKSRKSDVINRFARIGLHILYIPGNTSRFTWSFGRKLHRVNRERLKARIIVSPNAYMPRTHHVLPCIRRDTYLKKTARSEEEKSRATIRVHARRDCICVCV